METELSKAMQLIKNSKYLVVFTGAGISAESGVPPFRGENGIWQKYDPQIFDVSYFLETPEKAWVALKELLDTISKANPNNAHLSLSKLEEKGILKTIITQNIDSLHQKAGSKKVLEFHGTMKTVTCVNDECKHKYEIEELDITDIPPKCKECGAILKPDICFFGEDPHEPTKSLSFQEALKADVMIIIGTSGVVHPAVLIPIEAKNNGAKIIEINPDASLLTAFGVSDIFLQGKAGEIMKQIMEMI